MSNEWRGADTRTETGRRNFGQRNGGKGMGTGKLFRLHSFASIPLPNPFRRLGFRFRLSKTRSTGRPPENVTLPPPPAPLSPLSARIFAIIKALPPGRLANLCPTRDKDWSWSRQGFPRGFGSSWRGPKRVRDGHSLPLRRLSTLVPCCAFFGRSGSPHGVSYKDAVRPIRLLTSAATGEGQGFFSGAP